MDPSNFVFFVSAIHQTTMVSLSAARQGVVATTKRAYKRAKHAYKRDKSNDDLKNAKRKAKWALKEAEEGKESNYDLVDAAVAAAITPAMTKNENHDTDTSLPLDDDGIIEELERMYEQALGAFKSNKSDKDLRRAKTAARRALDDALLLAAGGDKMEHRTCMSCSKKFIVTSSVELKKRDKLGWTDRTSRCDPCRAEHTQMSNERRIKLDGKTKNMCYAFQRGECTRGLNCKFSHNPEHGGFQRAPLLPTE